VSFDRDASDSWLATGVYHQNPQPRLAATSVSIHPYNPLACSFNPQHTKAHPPSTLPSRSIAQMSGAVAGSSKKATVYVGGFADEVNEQQLLDAFVTFGASGNFDFPAKR
jgi:hypothetical protein